MSRRAIALALVLAGAGARAGSAETSRREAFAERQRQGPLDAAAARLGREAIAEARAAADETGLRDALVGTARVVMAAEGYAAAIGFLDGEAWPSAAPARLLLHLLAADAILGHVRRPTADGRLRESSEVLRHRALRERERVFLADRAAAERHLAESWPLRLALPDSPSEAFGVSWSEPLPRTPRIEETARDAFTYAWAGLVARRDGWRTWEVADRSSASAILSARPDPADTTAHALSRVAAALGDLEAWHLEAGRREAGLRAARARFRTVALGSFHGGRKSILGAFEERLRRDGDLPGFCDGLRELVDLVSQAGLPFPESREKARALSREGRSACPAFFPKPRRTLELSALAHDGAGRRSLRVSSRGLSRVYLFAWRVDPMALLPSIASVSSALERVLGEKPAASWSVEPELPDDDEPHTTWSVPPLREKGAYVIVASAAPEPVRERNLLEAAPFVLTGIVLASRSEGDGAVEAFVLDGKEGTPRRGVRVRRQEVGGEGRVFAEARTDASGRARLPAPPSRESTVLVASAGDDLAFGALEYGAAPPDLPPPLLVTDKRRYRPGEHVRFFVVATRRGESGKHAPDAGRTISVTLFDGTRKALRRLRPVTDDFGVASGALTIPADRPAGLWTLRTGVEVGEEDGRDEAAVSIEVLDDGGMQVELDPPPPFRPETPLRIGGRVTGPEELVREAGVSWTLSEGEALLASGEVPVRADGSFTATPEVPTAPDAGLRFQVVASSGPRATWSELRLAPERNALTVSVAAPYFALAGKPIRLAATRERGRDHPAPGESAYRITRLAAPEESLVAADAAGAALEGRTANDRRMARFAKTEPPSFWGATIPEERVVSEGVVTHDGAGRGEIRVGNLAPGLYEAEVRCEEARDSSRFLVLGRGGTVPVGAAALLLPARNSQPAGSRWPLLAHCGFPGQLFFLEHYLNGRLVSRAARRNGGLVSFPPTGGAHEARLWFVRDFQLVALDSPWVVGRDRQELDLSIAGSGEEVRITVRGADGKPPRPGDTEVFIVVGGEGGEPPEPFGLIHSPRESGPFASSWREQKATRLAASLPDEARPREAPRRGYVRMLGTGREPAAAAPVDPPMTGDAAPPPEDPLAFQLRLEPDARGVVRLRLPKLRPSDRVWVVAFSRSLGYGFLEARDDGR